jgi:hypothetical protein
VCPGQQSPSCCQHQAKAALKAVLGLCCAVLGQHSWLLYFQCSDRHANSQAACQR